MKATKQPLVTTADIEKARAVAEKLTGELVSAFDAVNVLTADLEKAKRRVTDLRIAVDAAKSELRSVAVWSVPGLPNDGDAFPRAVCEALNLAMEVRK